MVSGSHAPAIVCDAVSLRYRIPTERVGSLKEYAIRRVKRSLGVSDFWALREVTFSVAAGEVLGIVGRNGAGKTTLLKVIARVLRPSAGRVVVRGLVAPLLGLGAGFHDELTGRENVFLAGATLGFSTRHVAARFDSIVEFSGLGNFIDAPLRTYSSGMRARLGFAVATDAETDVLLVDEMLSVGDAAFRRQCEERIRAFRADGATVVIVSHSMSLIVGVCTRALLLEGGKIGFLGPAQDVADRYKQAAGGPLTANPPAPKKSATVHR